MQTEEEEWDYIADTNVVFAPVTAVFNSIAYCIPNAILAHAIGFTVGQALAWNRRRRESVSG